MLDTILKTFVMERAKKYIANGENVDRKAIQQDIKIELGMDIPIRTIKYLVELTRKTDIVETKEEILEDITPIEEKEVNIIIAQDITNEDRGLLLRAIQKSPKQISVLTDFLNMNESQIDYIVDSLVNDGFLIEKRKDGTIGLIKELIPQLDNEFNVDWDGNKIIRFGVVSDTHLGSKHQQMTHLNNIYDLFAAEGISTVYHSGDLTEGENMRRGHQYECFIHGADEVENYVIENYPSRPGMKTHFILGNHDTSFITHSGTNIGKYIAQRREDMIYYGNLNAVINITPNCKLELQHPLDGSAYALSYSAQKIADSLSGGEKPNILLIGHHHKAIYMFYRNIHMLECGTFEAQTPWMKGKRLAAHMGGWIVEVHVDSDGTVIRFKSEFIPYYRTIKHDY